MGQGKISIGVDTPTGEPANAPKGPYITDDNDGTQLPRPMNPKDKAPDKTSAKQKREADKSRKRS